MNNSKLTAMASSEDAFAAQHAHVFPPLQDQSLNEPLQGRRSFQYVDNILKKAEREYLEIVKACEVSDAPKSKLWLWSEGNRPDFGFWLLGGSAARSDRWKHLRGFPQGHTKNGGAWLKQSSEIFKRCCDILGSIFLLVILLPLFPMIFVAIKIDSRGPVFFRHYRTGKRGKHFVLWKFRSMRVDVSQYAISPRNVTDDRLTRIGRLIRRLSIDEIPQLINVLRGEMSLVGPRPEMPFIVDLFHRADSERLTMKPGITGLWQISPARAFPIHENLQYDLYYVRNQNVVLDCSIILRTIFAVIHGVGAV